MRFRLNLFCSLSPPPRRQKRVACVLRFRVVRLKPKCSLMFLKGLFQLVRHRQRLAKMKVCVGVAWMDANPFTEHLDGLCGSFQLQQIVPEMPTPQYVGRLNVQCLPELLNGFVVLPLLPQFSPQVHKSVRIPWFQSHRLLKMFDAFVRQSLLR